MHQAFDMSKAEHFDDSLSIFETTHKISISTEMNVDAVPSVAQCLPVDVLESIFLSCLPEFKPKVYDHITFPRPSTREAPMIYGRICRSWRDVSISTPRLWSFLRIPSYGDPAIGIEKWLRRSHSTPFSFQWNPWEGDYPNDMTERIISLLVSQSKRWFQVIICDSEDILNKLLTPLKGGVPRLEVLKLSIPVPFDGYILTPFVAPRLQYLHISGDVLFDMSTMPSIKQFVLQEAPPSFWTRSSHSWSYRNALFRILPACPKLELVDITIFDTSPVPSDLQVKMPFLRTASLRLAAKPLDLLTDIGPLLHKLILPSLETLSIDLYHGKEIPFLAIQSMITRSHAKLTSLSLYGTHDGQVISDDELIDCILHLPDLISLDLRRMPVTDTFTAALTAFPRNSESDELPVFCPVLSHLKFGGAIFSEGAVIDMIRSRWEHTNHAFSSVYFFSCNLSLSDGADLQLFAQGEAAKKTELILEMKKQE